MQSQKQTGNEPAQYRIQVEGQLDENWSGWFTGMTICCETGSHGQPITTLTGVVADQAALRGLLGLIWDMNLTIISVTREGGAS